MQKFLASARKYRPAIFDQVVGQENIVTTLQNAIRKQHLGQALLFTGPRGVGKTTCARIVAKELNPDISEQNAIYNIIEIDAASHNSVEDIRQMIETVRLPPVMGKFKIYIIDEVHMLSQAAFNAFLKTLEEPPENVVFILATTEKHKVLPTVLSRCQVYDFKRIENAEIVTHLKKIAAEENIQFEEEALHMIADSSDGSMRDGLSIFDKLCNFCDNNLVVDKVADNLGIPSYKEFIQLSQNIRSHHKPNTVGQLHHLLSRGFELGYILGGLSEHFKNLLLLQDPDAESILNLPNQTMELLKAESTHWKTEILYESIEALSELLYRYKGYSNPKLATEIGFLKLISIHMELKKKRLTNSESTLTSKIAESKSDGDSIQVQQIDLSSRSNFKKHLLNQEPKLESKTVSSHPKSMAEEQAKPNTVVEQEQEPATTKETPLTKKKSPPDIHPKGEILSKMIAQNPYLKEFIKNNGCREIN